MDKYDKPTKLVTLNGIGKVYKTPFSSAGLDLSPPDYYLYTNFDLKDNRKKIFPITDYALVIGKCDACRHTIVKIKDGFKHIILLGKFGKKDDKFCITDKCHCLEAGSENSYSTWGRRCRCKTPLPELGLNPLK